jgi:pimeloyl-ACP methyl ester carboxylesterase/DNA-binding CsgD family transcriptional regulator
VSASTAPLTYGRGVHRIGFCRADDGVQIAYGVHGSGPPLVKAANWMTHLDHDWRSPVWRHWLAALGERCTMVRYDERGCGLSDRDVGEGAFTLDRWVRDLECVVDAAGLDTFALLGLSQGAALSIEYMARNPGRVTHFVVCGGFARGRARRASAASAEENDTLAAMIRVGWGKSNAAFRRSFTTLFLPEGSAEQIEWFDDLQRVSASPETASRIFAARGALDVTARAPGLDVPTLVMHAREDAVVPFAEGRLIASLIPDARFVPLEGRNHVLLETEPAWGEFLASIDEFLGSSPVPTAPPDDWDLSAREEQILGLVADGLSNEAIAEQLVLSVRTVERHLSNCYAKLRVSGKAARAAAAARYVRATRHPVR